MTFWRGRRVLIAGGSGFVGRALCAALGQRGAQVTSTHRGLREYRGEAGESGEPATLLADLTDVSSAATACHEQDVVFVAAAADGNAEFKRRRAAHIFHTNSLISLNILEAARREGVRRVVLISSAEVYAGAAGETLVEDASIDDVRGGRLNSYALAKLFGEIAARNFHDEYGLSVGIARPANIYGPGDDLSPARGRVVNQWIMAGVRGEPLRIWGTGEEVRSFVFIEDVVEGLLRIAEASDVQTPVNLAHAEPIRLRDLAELIICTGGFNSTVELMPNQAAGPSHRILDTALAERVLGFCAIVGFNDGLRRTIDAIRSAHSKTGIPPAERAQEVLGSAPGCVGGRAVRR